MPTNRTHDFPALIALGKVHMKLFDALPPEVRKIVSSSGGYMGEQELSALHDVYMTQGLGQAIAYARMYGTQDEERQKRELKRND